MENPHPAAEKCPSCRRPAPEAAPLCPHCRLTLRQLDLKFGTVPLHSAYLTDRAEALPLAEIKKLRALLQLFDLKFPQSLFSVFVVDLPKGSASEFAFWLANRARFNHLEATGPENFDLLLVVDVGSKSAALIIGYGLENYVSEEDLDQALTAAFPSFDNGDLAAGIRLCVEWMTQRLRDLSRAAGNNPGPNERLTESRR